MKSLLSPGQGGEVSYLCRDEVGAGEGRTCTSKLVCWRREREERCSSGQ